MNYMCDVAVLFAADGESRRSVPGIGFKVVGVERTMTFYRQTSPCSFNRLRFESAGEQEISYLGEHIERYSSPTQPCC